MPEPSSSSTDPDRSSALASAIKGFQTLFIGTHDAPMHFPPTVTARSAINNVLKGRVEVVAEREVVNALGEAVMIPEIVRSKHLFEGLHNRITGVPASFNLRNLALREGFRCQYDEGAPLLKLRSLEPETRGTFDHIVPASQGGERAWLNAAFTSETLNVLKADRTPREAGLYLCCMNHGFRPYKTCSTCKYATG